jgi:hypothetical protein
MWWRFKLFAICFFCVLASLTAQQNKKKKLDEFNWDDYLESIYDNQPFCPCDSFLIKNPDFDRISWLADTFGTNGYRARYDKQRFSTFEKKLEFIGFDRACLTYYLGMPLGDKYCGLNNGYPLSASFSYQEEENGTLYTIYNIARPEHSLQIYYHFKTGGAYPYWSILSTTGKYYTSIPQNPELGRVFCADF